MLVYRLTSVPTNRLTDRPGHKEVTLPIIYLVINSRHNLFSSKVLPHSWKWKVTNDKVKVMTMGCNILQYTINTVNPSNCLAPYTVYKKVISQYKINSNIYIFRQQGLATLPSFIKTVPLLPPLFLPYPLSLPSPAKPLPHMNTKYPKCQATFLPSPIFPTPLSFTYSMFTFDVQEAKQLLKVTKFVNSMMESVLEFSEVWKTKG